MPASSYGIIVEGTYDSAVYETVIRRLASHDVYIKALDCEGRAGLMKKFPGLLWTFDHAVDGGPVDMALVIRDADGKLPDYVERKMRPKIAGRQYRFRLGVQFYVVSQAMDAWLLADVTAVNKAVVSRGGKPIARLHEAPEGLLNPKEWMRNLLTEHKVAYTPELCRDVAKNIGLQLLAEKCPRFRGFSDLVDC